jgi:hypothetical protein
MRKLPKARSGGETHIGRATAPGEIKHVWPVMRELRAHHADEGAFVRQVQRQMREGYRLVYLDGGGECRAAAGYRVMEMLFSGARSTSTISSRGRAIAPADSAGSCSTGL